MRRPRGSGGRGAGASMDGLDSGFRGTEQVLKDYAVPVEVWAKMGATRPR